MAERAKRVLPESEAPLGPAPAATEPEPEAEAPNTRSRIKDRLPVLELLGMRLLPRSRANSSLGCSNSNSSSNRNSKQSPRG